nr:MAG TPA: Terminase small subunit [Caudoviricetes sp.]DAR67163.1 MAG TPA: Terminase small subunit [Caudoviricetes sp.]
MAKMTERQRRFCEEYLIDGNASQAAIRAGYSKRSATVVSTTLMKNPQVQAYLKKLLDELHSAKVANAQEVLEYLTSIMRGEQREQTLQLIGDGMQDITAIDVAAKDRLKAAELLGKRYGIFKENVGVTMDAVVIVDDLKE